MTQSDKKALEEFEELTKIPCTCHDDFKQRKLKDPSCFGCLHGEECKNACAKILQEARNEERQRIVEIAAKFLECKNCNGAGGGLSQNLGFFECSECGGDGHCLYGYEGKSLTDIITALTEQK